MEVGVDPMRGGEVQYPLILLLGWRRGLYHRFPYDGEPPDGPCRNRWRLLVRGGLGSRHGSSADAPWLSAKLGVNPEVWS